jgi:hypothetical protein
MVWNRSSRTCQTKKPPEWIRNRKWIWNGMVGGRFRYQSSQRQLQPSICSIEPQLQHLRPSSPPQRNSTLSTPGLLDCWIAGLLDCWTAGVLDCWTAGLLDCCTAGLLDCWTAGLLDCWTAGLLDCWAAGLLDCWIVACSRYHDKHFVNCS